MDIKQILEKSKQERLENFKSFQEKIQSEKFDNLGFRIFVCDFEEESFNTSRGFFTSAYVYWRGILFATIVPNFPETSIDNEIKGLEIEFRASDHLSNLILSSENGFFDVNEKELKVKSRGHKDIQSCLRELERIRVLIVRFWN